MTINSVEIIVADILVEDRVDQDLNWGQEYHEDIVIHISVGNSSTKSTFEHV